MDQQVLHLDIDAFFASVEQLRNPRLKGKPVIVGSGCIASCSYEARKYGLYAGQSLCEAKRLCPKAVVLEGNYSVYRCFANRIWKICRTFCPSVDTYLDDAYLDLTGTEHLYPDLKKSAAKLKSNIKRETELSVTVGVGPTRIVARMASKSAKPDGLRLVEPSEVLPFLARFAVDKLPGVGHKTSEVLKRLNIYTVGELRNLPRDGLEALFGKLGIAIYDRCRGLDTMITNKKEIPHSISRETTFHKETTNRAEIEGMLYYLTERIGSTLRQLGCAAKTVHLKIRYGDFEGENASQSLPEATDVDEEIHRAVVGILNRIYTRRVALRHIAISVSRILLSEKGRRSLFETGEERAHRLLSAIDEIRGRFGFSAITVGKAINLLGNLKQDSYGYVLRTPSLTK
jgi:DNA polymerase-4